jgi:hypothetical protein
VTLTRLDGQASASFGPGTNATSPSLGGTAMLVGVDFPGPGCWRVTAQYRGTALSYVVWIVLAVPSMPATPPTVILPDNAPLKPTDCGWPATTPLAFAGYATVADLDAEQITQGSPNEHVYALVTRDPVELVPMIGSPMLERGFCALRQDGSQTESAVGADWTFKGTQQNPVVTCGGTATSCVRETLVVLDAVASVGHPATRITFRLDEMCIGAPFGGRPCAAPAWPDGTQRMTSAVATFSGTEQQAFLTLFWLADDSISADMMALEAPPPGATPYP